VRRGEACCPGADPEVLRGAFSPEVLGRELFQENIQRHVSIHPFWWPETWLHEEGSSTVESC